MSIGFLFLVMGVIGCVFTPNSNPIQKTDTITVHDTVFLDSPYQVDTIAQLRDSIARIHSAKRVISSREKKAVERIEQIKYYVNICDRNPSQKVFIFGWVKRALK